jgi:hypothetical protein
LPAVNAPVEADPDAAFEPVQSPLATQLVSLLLVQVSVELPPLETLSGDAAKDSVGADAGCWTITVAVAEPEPPAPLQARAKVEFAVNGPTLCDPLVALAPDHAPDAAQEVASVADHVSVDVPPAAIDAGLAVKVVTGDAGGATGGVNVATSAVACADVVPPNPTQLNT